MSEIERRQTPTERNHELLKLALERPAPVSGVPSFQIDQEKAVGGSTVNTHKVHVPVCEWFPTPDEAFDAAVGYAVRLRHLFPPPNDDSPLTKQLQDSITKPAKPRAVE